MELISREEATKAFDTYFKDIQYRARRKHTTKGETALYLDLKGVVESLPTVEERNVGEWLDNGDKYYRCSLCGMKDTDNWKFCRGCGAYMKGE